jgi:AraC family transcriptional activator of pobA
VEPNQTDKLASQYSLIQMVKWTSLYEGELAKYATAVFRPGHMLQNSLYKITFYGIALCISGTAELHANDEIYQIKENSLMVMGPQIVLKWINASEDFCAKTFGFTEDFFLEDNSDATLLRRFNIFQLNTTKVVHLRDNETSALYKLLEEVKHLVISDSKRKHQMIRSYIYILLSLAADSFERYCGEKRGLQQNPCNLTDRFTQLLNIHYLDVRSVCDYANLLFVTPNHLSETVKLATGKTAGQLIDEIVLMEAKIRVKQTALSVSQIASFMNFSDVSAFCKFFRRHTGLSPSEYRRQ